VILWNIDYLLLSNGVTIHPAVCRRVFAMPDAICAAHHKTIVSRIESSKPANLKQCVGSEILRGAVEQMAVIGNILTAPCLGRACMKACPPEPVITGASAITDFNASGSSWSTIVYDSSFAAVSTAIQARAIFLTNG
jgi:hypothetical protein